jgi:hypothetical protein
MYDDYFTKLFYYALARIAFFVVVTNLLPFISAQATPKTCGQILAEKKTRIPTPTLIP